MGSRCAIWSSKDATLHPYVIPFLGAALPRMQEAADGPFDLFKGPLFAATLFQRGDEHSVLLLSMHHAITDGWSMNVLMEVKNVSCVHFCFHVCSAGAEHVSCHFSLLIYHRCESYRRCSVCLCVSVMI